MAVRARLQPCRSREVVVGGFSRRGPEGLKPCSRCHMSGTAEAALTLLEKTEHGNTRALLKESKGMTFRRPAVHSAREFVVRRQRSLPFGLCDRPHGVEHEFRILLRVFAVEDSASAHNNIRSARGGRADVLAGDAAVEGDQLPKPERLDSRLYGLDPPPSGGNKLLSLPSWIYGQDQY